MSEKLRTAMVLGLRFVFLTRYSWLMALAFLGLPPLALVGAPTLLENLFVLDRPVQMLHVSWIAMFSATTVITTLRITTLNAIDRFGDYRRASEDFQAAWGTVDPGATPWYRRCEVWFMLGLGLAASLSIWYGVVAACVSRTAADPGPAWGAFDTAEQARVAVTTAAWRQAYLGLFLTLSVLATIYLILLIRDSWFSSHILDDQSYQYTPGQRTSATRPGVAIAEQPLYEFLTYLFGPGYFRAITMRCRNKGGEYEQEKIVLAPGHAGLVLCTSLFFGWYGWNYWNAMWSGQLPDASSPLPALFFGLLSLLLLTLLLPGGAFLLDRHRIPVLPTLLLTMALMYSLFGTDHVFEVDPEPPVVESPAMMSWDEWLARRPAELDAHGTRTLVVVDASGGGIQASAWTAQVLTGLHELYGDPFSRSIGLISAVSGGSVGTLFYLANRSDLADEANPTHTVLSPEAIRHIRESSRASGLEATCWGIAYPDTMRAVFPPLSAETIDRGWSIEQSWRKWMGSTRPGLENLRLRDLAPRQRTGTLPIPVFNATLVETGQRLLISPVTSPPPVGDQSSAGVEFLRVFPGSQLRATTAARLSATFPYVTPVARPLVSAQRLESDPHNPLFSVHVADGAYADNEGAVTSVDWINRLLVYYSRPENIDQRPFDRVLLVRIQAFPRELARTSRPANRLSGWRAALLGPFDTMMKVRSASQTERGDLEINLLTRATLAELRAAKERAEREFQLALTQVDQLERMMDELRFSGKPGEPASEAARRVREEEDKWRFAISLLQSSQDRQRRLTDLQVESVVFDFHPADGVSIPMSWKLTARQQRQIDRTWEQLANGYYPHQPLAVVDRYFRRLATIAPRLARE